MESAVVAVRVRVCVLLFQFLQVSRLGRAGESAPPDRQPNDMRRKGLLGKEGSPTTPRIQPTAAYTWISFAKLINQFDVEEQDSWALSALLQRDPGYRRPRERVPTFCHQFVPSSGRSVLLVVLCAVSSGRLNCPPKSQVRGIQDRAASQERRTEETPTVTIRNGSSKALR